MWLQLLMTTSPFGGMPFTGGYVPDPSDQMTRDFDTFFKSFKKTFPETIGL